MLESAPLGVQDGAGGRGYTNRQLRRSFLSIQYALTDSSDEVKQLARIPPVDNVFHHIPTRCCDPYSSLR